MTGRIAGIIHTNEWRIAMRQILIRPAPDEEAYISEQSTSVPMSRAAFVCKCVRYARDNGLDLKLPAKKAAK